MWLILAIGCLDREERESVREEAMRDAMAEHWVEAREVREALIDGDLRKARRSARAMEAKFRTPLDGDATAADAVLAGATVIAEASDVATAAEGFGATSWSCGQCHAAVGTPILLGEASTPPTDLGLAAEMKRHRAAEERVWLALVRPDDAELAAALAILATAPLVPPDAPGSLPPHAAELEGSVHELAVAIAAAQGPDRGARYGELLTTCAVCHRVVRDAK